MRNRRWRPVFAILSAAAGTGFASGREIIGFFSQTRRAAWVGIPFAGLVFALLVGMVARQAVRYDAPSVPGLCRRMLNRRSAGVTCAMYALLLVVCSVVMLRRAGEIAAIALPIERAFVWGAAFALLACSGGNSPEGVATAFTTAGAFSVGEVGNGVRQFGTGNE